MAMERQITISTANSRRAAQWLPQTMSWERFAERARRVVTSKEKMEEYLALPKSAQDDLKDVGGFVGGMLEGNLRSAGAVLRRDLVTLDLDSIPEGGTENTLRKIDGLGCAYAVYSTRKHSPAAPRLRVVLPLDEPCTADEYEPIARAAAGRIATEFCDRTTFEASRLMYWPSRCADGQFVFACSPPGRMWLSREQMLRQQADGRDGPGCPSTPGGGKEALPDNRPARLGDPAEKSGIVGAFCRQYDVRRAITELLPGLYAPTGMPDRYTYTKGTTAGGAVVYDGGRFLYSHHATDPVCGREVNSFDLVRLHLFGARDSEAAPGMPAGRLPSFLAMTEYAQALPDVARAMRAERLASADREFAAVGGNGGEADASLDSTGNADWMSLLAVNKATGALLKTVDNVVLILENDPDIRGGVVFDEFSQRAYVVGNLPWRAFTPPRRTWTDKDDDQLVRYLEKAYGITGDSKVFHGLGAYLDSHAINEVRDYILSLKWDEVPRLDTLFIDYLGAADSPYARAATRKSFVAAVARALEPGIQYDHVPILRGGQGIGKSTVLRVMGGAWYCDSLETFEGKDAAELLQGMWVIELGELTALSRSEAEAAKHFLTKRDDQFRVPYGRQVSIFPRRCAFWGTTNRHEYLRDTTGNRRFWPLDCDDGRRRKSPWLDLPGERDQIWAEAAHRWLKGAEKLYLPEELEAVAIEQQREHLEEDPRTGMVAEFLGKPLPKNWMKRTIPQRMAWWGEQYGAGLPQAGDEDRRTVSRQEIWVECFRRDPALFGRREAAEIDAVMAAMPGWARHPSTFRNGPYGTEKGYQRVAGQNGNAVLA